MTELYPQKCLIVIYLGPVVCKALHGVIVLPFASAEVLPDFNHCTQILQWGLWVNLSLNWDHEGSRNFVMWESGERTEVGREDSGSVSWRLSQPFRACLVMESGGGSLYERSMCQQGWYSCQLRRPKTWVWVLIFLLIYLFTIFQFWEYLTQCLDSILPTAGYMECYIITGIRDFILNRIQT